MSRDVSDFYKSMFKEHGMTAEGVAWRDRALQEKRWRLLLAGNLFNVKTMLDVGCGYGGLVPYLHTTKKLWFNYVSYVGIDVVKEYIDAARGEFQTVEPNHDRLNSRVFGLWDVREYAELHDRGDGEMFDLVVCSGALTYHDMPEKLAMLDAMWQLTGGTLAFNMRAQEAYLADISMILPRFGSGSYKILHDYGLDEMTVVVKRT